MGAETNGWQISGISLIATLSAVQVGQFYCEKGKPEVEQKVIAAENNNAQQALEDAGQTTNTIK